MTEALAERLLDLHVRLLSLYIIQDSDCLHWEREQPFFESERGFSVSNSINFMCEALVLILILVLWLCI